MEKGFHALKGMAKNLQYYPSSTRTCAALNLRHTTGLPTRRLTNLPLLSHYSFKNSRQRAEC